MSTLNDYDFILSIAKDLGIEEGDLNTVSSLGHVTRVMQDYMELNDMRLLDDKKQKFISTATKMSALYKHAAREAIEPDKAYSSTLPIHLYVYVEDILNADIIDPIDERRIFTISKDNIFNLGEAYSFRLDYDIEIVSYMSGGVRKYLARYDMDIWNPISELLSPGIKSRKYVYNNKECVLLEINVRDYKVISSELSYLNTASSSTFNINFNNYIERIECLYKDEGDADFRTINTAMFFDKDIESETIFYIIKQNLVTFINKYKTGQFYPTPGGRFRFNIYTTTARTFSEYIGDTSIQLSDDADYTLDFNVVGGATGGQSPMNKEELRSEILRYNSTNGSLISSADVETYLESVGTQDTKYKAFKYIDNFNDRIYNIIAQVNKEDIMIPTNTANLRMSESYCKLLGNGRFMTYDLDQEFVSILTEKGSIEVLSKSEFLNNTKYASYNKTNYIKYAIPFQLTYDRKYNILTSFEKLVNRIIQLKYDFMAESTDTFVVNNFLYFYEVDYSEPDDYFQMHFSLEPIDEDNLERMHTIETNLNGDEVLSDTGFMKAVIALKEKGQTIGYMPASMFAFDAIKGKYDMRTYFRMLSPVYSDNLDLRFYDMNHEVVERTIDINNTEPVICIYTESNGYEDLTSQTETPKFDDFYLVNTYSLSKASDTEHMFFREISHSLATQINDKVIAVSSATPFGAIKNVLLDKIPFIRYDYFEANQNDVRSLLETEFAVMDSIKDKVEGAFKIRLNLANTYGYSERLRIGLSGKVTGTTHFYMVVKVRLKAGYSLTENTIATFINDYFKSIEFQKGETFHFSELVDAIKTEYTEISFIELASVNGIENDNQYIYMEDYDNIQFIPEIPNIARRNDNSLDISILFV